MEIKERQIRDFAQCAASQCFKQIIAGTDIDRMTALEAVKNAEDAFEVTLKVSLRGKGVEIVQEARG